MLFEAIQFLRPLPSTWSSSTPLSSWGSGISEGGCFPGTNAGGGYFSVVFSAALQQTFTENRTLRLDLLNPAIPLCAIEVQPVVEAALVVVVDFVSLPTSLQVLNLPSVNLQSQSLIGNKVVNLTALPPQFSVLDLSNTGIEGSVDLTNINVRIGSVGSIVNLSSNPGITGGIDVVQQALCGALNGHSQFQWDFRSTGITIAFAAAQYAGYYCTSATTSMAPAGLPVGLFVDSGVWVQSVDNQPFPFLVDDGYYCLPVSDGSTTVPFIRFARQDGLDWIFAVNPPYECSMVLTGRFATFDIGYIYDSPVYATALWPCLPKNMIFAAKTAAIAYEIAIYDTNSIQNGTLNWDAPAMVFGICPDPASDDGADTYFSVSLGEHIFFDYIYTGLNVTSRGYQLDGTYAECFFGSHVFTEIPAPNGIHTLYNDGQLIRDLQNCLPTTDAANNSFGQWIHATMSANENRLFFHDTVGNTLTLHRFSNTIVLPNVTYCVALPTKIYSWNVSRASSTMTVAHPNGTVINQCTYDGVLQFLTVETPSEFCTIYQLESVVRALGPCLPPSASGAARNWSPASSRVNLDPGSFIFGSILLVDANTSEVFTFSNNSCTTSPQPSKYCSNVDLFTGSLVLTVLPNMSTELTHYQRGTHFQNITKCVSNNALVFDASGAAILLDLIAADWISCIPAHSSTALFQSLKQITFNNAGVIELVANTSGTAAVNSIALMAASCKEMSIMPNSVVMCPPLPPINQSFTVQEACFAGWCRPFQSVSWSPTSSSTDGDIQWTTGTQPLYRSDLALTDLSPISNVSAGSISACYPTCFVDVTDCDQIAYLLGSIFMCYVKRGLIVGSAALPELPAFCSTSQDAVIPTLSRIMAVESLNPTTSTFSLQCLGSQRGIAFTTPAAASQQFVLGTSDNAVGFGYYAAYETWGAGIHAPLMGITAYCSTCRSVWLLDLFPTPLVLIGLNSIMNMALLIIANFAIQPLIGPRIVKLKVKFLVALGALSRREVRSYEKWLLRCLRPYIASKSEIKYHVDSVCKIVNAERRRLMRLKALSIDAKSGSSSESEHDGSPQRPSQAQPRLSGKSGYGTAQNKESPEEKAEGDARFQELYRKHIMRGVRMLSGVGEISLRKLVDLRDACSIRPCCSGRKTLIRFPLRKHKSGGNRYMSELTADHLLLSEGSSLTQTTELSTVFRSRSSAGTGGIHVEDEQQLTQPLQRTMDASSDSHSNAAEVDDDDEYQLRQMLVDEISLSNASMASDDAELEDALASVDSDVTADWIPFVLAEEWMDRQFLSPRDWLLLLQLLYVMFLFGRQFAAAVADSGATSSWEVYSAFYFYFVGSSAPVSLLVNAVFRVVYAKDVNPDPTAGRRREDASVTSPADLDTQQYLNSDARIPSSTTVLGRQHSATSQSESSSSSRAGSLARAYFVELRKEPFFLIPLLMLLPPLVSHIITGMVMFPFLLFGTLVVILVTKSMRVGSPEVDYEKGSLRHCSPRTLLSIVSRIVFRQVVMFATVASVQLAFSYAVLVYKEESRNEGIPWVDIIQIDFNARSVACAIEQVQRSAASAWSLVYSQFS